MSAGPIDIVTLTAIIAIMGGQWALGRLLARIEARLGQRIARIEGRLGLSKGNGDDD